MTAPKTWFDPLKVPALSRGRFAIPLGQPDWAARYLLRVLGAATQHRVCSMTVMWTHFRWLTRIARGALTRDDRGDLLESEVLAAWLPGVRYVYLNSTDRPRQALRWYSAQHPELGVGAGGPDFQEVRWMETILETQHRSWQTYFDVHSLEPEEVGYEDFAARQVTVVNNLLDSLGFDDAHFANEDEVPEGSHDRQSVIWLSDYLAVRPRTRAAAGVRSRTP